MKKNFVLFLAILLVSVSACKNPFFKNMLDKNSGNASSVPEKPQLPNPQEPANPANPEVPEPQLPKYTLTFGVDGANGTLKATVDGSEINSGNEVEKGKSVVFTAEPDAGYEVKEWKVDGAVVTGNTSNTYTHTVTAAVDVKVSFDVTFVEGGAVLTLSPDKLDIKVKVVTSDGNPVTVEGCTETSLASGNSTYTELHAQGTVVILKGKITELYCGDYYNGIRNKLTALNIQGLSSLQVLWCNNNQLTALNVQGLSALRELDCRGNQLTALNVQGLSALQKLYCYKNQLATLNVQGLSALRELGCRGNQLTAEAFTQIFTDLPQCTAGYRGYCYLYTEQTGEGNCKDFTTPAELQAAFQNAKNVKKWKMYKVNTSGYGEEI